MNLTFVSTNAGKYREVRAILAEYGTTVRWRRQALPETQSSSLETVVLGKLAAAARDPTPVLVEDSGLFIPALGGFPGVYSAYVLESIGLDGVLRLLRGRPRRAIFRTAAGLAIGRRRWIRRGQVRGRIADRPRGTHGFGFDPIFVPDGRDRTYGQLETTQKSRQSHRAKAIRQIGRLLRQLERAG